MSSRSHPQPRPFNVGSPLRVTFNTTKNFTQYLKILFVPSVKRKNN